MSGRSAGATRRGLLQTDMSSLLRRRRTDGEDPERPRFRPTLPEVNVLPASVRVSIRVRKLVRLFVLLALLLVVASGGVWYLQSDRIARAENAVETATEQNVQLQDDLAALAPIRELYGEITRLQELVATTLAAQPRAAAVITEVIAAGEESAGKDISFSSIDVVYKGIPVPGADLNVCPNPDPFTEEITIGCVTFSATVASREQVSNLLRALGEDSLFVGPYVTTSNVSSVEGQGDVVAFTGSAGISAEGLVTPLTDEEIDAIVNPPAQDEDSSQTSGDGNPDEAAGEAS